MVRNPLPGPSSKAGCGILIINGERRAWYLRMPCPGYSSSAFEDGPGRGFRNVGTTHSDAGEILKRKYTRFRIRRKFEIKNDNKTINYMKKLCLADTINTNTGVYRSFLRHPDLPKPSCWHAL
jgi:hypothetical protein